MEYRKLGRIGLAVFELAVGTIESGGMEYGEGIPQAALARLLASAHRTAPIIGADSVEQLQDNLAGVGLRLAEETQVLKKLGEWRET